MRKNLFTTTCFWSIVFTLFLAIEPKLEELSDRPFTLKDWLNLSATLASTSLTLMGIHEAAPNMCTPRWLPGRNKEN